MDDPRLIANPQAVHGAYSDALRALLSEAGHHAAYETIRRWPEYAPTTLHLMPQLACELRIEKLWIKDESTRFGLSAFKPIGAAYAIARAVGERADPSTLTFACASAGNHGRAVAWAARRVGARCVVYLNQTVSAARAQAIRDLGATVNLKPPDYDTAVRQVAEDAEKFGWTVISDTAYSCYTDIPRDIMHGYTVIAQEVIHQLDDERPTHVILQAGVGGFAAAVAARLWQVYGADRPTLITAEPTGAACVLESINAERPERLPHVQSIMGGLCCGVVSAVAWPILQQAIDYAAAIPDGAVPPVMRALAEPRAGDPAITAGESGAAGLATLHFLAQSENRRLVRLDRDARVLVFVTDGITDPERYRQLTRSAVPA